MQDQNDDCTENEEDRMKQLCHKKKEEGSFGCTLACQWLNKSIGIPIKTHANEASIRTKKKKHQWQHRRLRGARPCTAYDENDEEPSLQMNEEATRSSD